MKCDCPVERLNSPHNAEPLEYDRIIAERTGQAGEGVGGGGRVKFRLFPTEELSLGPATQKGIGGMLGVFPPNLETKYGFRIGGLISHAFFKPYSVTFDFGGMRILLRA